MGEYAEDRLEWEMGRAGVPGYGRRRPAPPDPQIQITFVDDRGDEPIERTTP